MFQDFYSKLTPQEKKIFYVALAIVLLMVVDRLFLGPAFSKMKAYDEEIEQQKRNIQQDLRFLTYKDQILNDDESLRPYYVNEYTTEEQVLAAFLKKIEMIATESKIVLIKVSPAETKERKGYKEYYANLECEGLLENVAAFMHAVDTSQDLLKIIKVSFTLKRASGDEVIAAMVVSKMFMGSDLKKEKNLTVGGGSSSSQTLSDRVDQQGTGGGSKKQPSEGQETSLQAGSGGASQSEQDPEAKTLEMPPASQDQGEGENVSWRYQMKGMKPGKNDPGIADKNEPAEPLKRSIFEKIVTKAEKKTTKDPEAASE